MPFDRKEYRKKYYQINKEKCINRCKLYREANKLALNKKCKEYDERNKLQRKRYNQLNKKKIRKYSNQYHYNLYHTNLEFRLLKSLRCRLYKAVKAQNRKKTYSANDLIGCTIQELQIHLEKQFKPGMTWDNYGRWHIDHINACANFNLVLRKEQQKCFHYTNLQPLWATENSSKGKHGNKDLSYKTSNLV